MLDNFTLNDTTKGANPWDIKTGVVDTRLRTTITDSELTALRGTVLPMHIIQAAIDARLETTGWQPALDEFSQDIFMKGLDGIVHQATEDEAHEIIVHLAHAGHKPPSKDVLYGAIRMAAKLNSFDSARRWFTSLLEPEYYAAPRANMDEQLCYWLGVDVTSYHKAVIRYFLTAAVGRVLSPGCVAPMIPILIGHQGTYKSMAVQALVPFNAWHNKTSLANTDADIARLTKGRLIIELDEMKGLRTRESDAIKSWVTTTHDAWIPKYKEAKITIARRWIAFGTSNEVKLFTDSTGNRRWLPMLQRGFDAGGGYVANPYEIRENVAEIWTYGMQLYKKHGIMYKEAEGLATTVLAFHETVDVLHVEALKYLNSFESINFNDALTALRDRLGFAPVKAQKAYFEYLKGKSRQPSIADNEEK